MKATVVISHMALANVLVLLTIIGIAGIGENGGGYLWIFLTVFPPFALGAQIMFIINTFTE
jgi:hypothetical protein